MIRVRRSAERGHFDHGWLDTYHSFSFGDYWDPAHMRFRALRVLNEDRVAPGTGFGRHGHRDMEILTLVRAGALEHRDSLGHGSVLRAGQCQRMTAGTGVEHSEFNPSSGEAVHLYQIWIYPERKGLEPSYEQTEEKHVPAAGEWVVVAAGDEGKGLLRINQDVEVWHGGLDQAYGLEAEIRPGRHAWIQVIEGSVTVNGLNLVAGDGAGVNDEEHLQISAEEPAQVLLFDLA